jgi:hypothetical protein
VTLVETGPETQIDGRTKRLLPYMSDDDAFCLTYGDVSATSLSCHRFGQSLGGQGYKPARGCRLRGAVPDDGRQIALRKPYSAPKLARGQIE